MLEKRFFRNVIPGLIVFSLIAFTASPLFAQRGKGRGRQHKAHQERMKEIHQKLSGVLEKKEFGEFFRKMRGGEFTEEEFEKYLSQERFKKVITKADVNFLKEELKQGLLRKKMREEGKEPVPGKQLRDKLVTLLGERGVQDFWKKFKDGNITEKELTKFLSQEKLKDKLSKADVNKLKDLRKRFEVDAKTKKKIEEKKVEKDK